MLQYKKTVAQKVAQNLLVLHGTGSQQVRNDNFKLSLSGEDYLVLDIAVARNALPNNTVVRAHFYTQDIYLGFATQTLGPTGVNTTISSKLTDEKMARAEYAIFELLFPKHVTDDYEVTVLATALQATEAAVLTGANVINDAGFAIGIEAANIIPVTVQLKDIFGAAISERKPVYYAVCSDAIGDTIAAVDAVAAHAGSNCAVKEELTANASGLGTTNVNGQMVLDLTHAAGALTRYLVIECDGKRFVSPAIVFA